jgi:Transglutaminase-like superfamily
MIWQRRVLSFLPDVLRPRARVAEAMILLIGARLLVRFVPMRHWRGSLGRVGGGDITSVAPARDDRRAIRAIIRVTQRLPIEMPCLPRAMAAQWMLARRGTPSALVFGILPEQARGDIHALHAWVEVGGQIVIGNDPGRAYHRCLVLVQP